MPSVWDPPVSRARSNFATTHWSVVLAARCAGDAEGEARAAEARAALEQLCRTYWPPIYSFLRRRGHAHDDAGQLTQEFFLRLLERRDFDRADPARGRFRSWLLQALKNFLANEWKKTTAGKRDERKLIWVDALAAEQRYQFEPSHHSDPEREYQRDCALAVLERAFQRLRAECDERGRGWLFEQVQKVLVWGPDDGGYAELSSAVGETTGNLKTTVARWRQRWAEIVREELAGALDVSESPQPRDAIDAELHFLLAALSPGRSP